MSRIAVIGSYGVGMTMNIPRLPEAGETLRGGPFALGPGGKGSNQAIGARRLGVEVDFVTCVGPDAFGREARDLWQREGVGAQSIKIGTQPTMVGFILIEPGGENRIVIAPGALEELTPADIRERTSLIAGADLCLVSLEIPLETAIEALRVAREVGTPTLLNPAPAAVLPEHAWSLIDYLTPNGGEARILANLDATAPSDAILERLRQCYSGVFVMTQGKDGVILAEAEGLLRLPSVRPRRVVDTTGAGDAFTAAFAVAVVEKMSLREAVRFAAAAGAFAVENAEVIPSLPRRNELEAYIKDRR